MILFLWFYHSNDYEIHIHKDDAGNEIQSRIQCSTPQTNSNCADFMVEVYCLVSYSSYGRTNAQELL